MPSESWAELYPWQLDRASRTPFFRQIYAQIRRAVLSGALGPGTKLPSSRALAVSLGVARASVVAVYEQLLTEGYIETRRGAGTFVSAAVAGLGKQSHRGRAGDKRSLRPPRAFLEFERAQQHDERLPFNTGRTLIDARTAEIWRKLMQYAGRSLGAGDLGYTDPSGLPELRRCLCEYLRASRAVRCDPEQIVVTAGTQQAADIAIRVLLEPGDEVWVEDPGYPLTYAQLLWLKFSRARYRWMPMALLSMPGSAWHPKHAVPLSPRHISFRPGWLCRWLGVWNYWPGRGRAARSSWRTTTPANSATRVRRSHRSRGSMTMSG
jgi:GntR family transcriptional regulator/MocR family aminotransferase